MSKYQLLPFLFLILFLDACSNNNSGTTGGEVNASDSSLLTKSEVMDSLATKASNDVTEEYSIKEEVLSITEQNLLIKEGNWLARNCFPPGTYSFTADKVFLASNQTKPIPPQWNLVGDTLTIFYSDSVKDVYKIVTLTTRRMSLHALQFKEDYLSNCGEDSEITLYRDKVINSVKTIDIAGSWGNGESLLLKTDGTFEYEAPPACYTSGSWELANGKLMLTFSADPCLDEQIENTNDISVTDYTLYIKSHSQKRDKYRTLYRQDRY